MGIARPSAEGTWEGAAFFPRALGGEARQRFEDLETDIDVEDQVMTWETWELPKGAYGHSGGPTWRKRE